MMSARSCFRVALCWGMLALFVNSYCRAALLAEYNFGDSAAAATTAAQVVAAHISADSVTGVNSQTQQVAPHALVEFTPGNMAMRLLQAEGGDWFVFTLHADPGFTFQVSDARFTYQHWNTAGGGRNITVTPNADPDVLWYDITGGDVFADVGPGSFGWKMNEWNVFVQRTDLTTLRVVVGMHGNANASTAYLDRVQISGDVIAVPEPVTLALLVFCPLVRLQHRRRG